MGNILDDEELKEGDGLVMVNSAGKLDQKIFNDNSSISSNKANANDGSQLMGDYWKVQFEEIQAKARQNEFDKKVLDRKNQILEEKCMKLES